MKNQLNDIYWLAALLEGEGSFYFNNASPAIYLKMSDLDVVTKAHKIFNTSASIQILKKKEKWKQQYQFAIVGNLAVQWMMTIYSLMGVRRKARIRAILEVWKMAEKGKKMHTSKQILDILELAYNGPSLQEKNDAATRLDE